MGESGLGGGRPKGGLKGSSREDRALLHVFIFEEEWEGKKERG